MPISASCPSCGGKIKAPDNLAGRTVKCPKCSAPMTLPAGEVITEAIQEASPAPLAPPPAPSAPPPARRQSARAERDDRDRDDDYDRDDRDIARPSQGGTNGLAIAGLVLGLVGLPLAFIPCFGWVLALLMGIIGTTLSGIGLASAKKLGSGKSMAIAGLVLSILAMILGPSMYFILFYSAVNTANQALQQAMNQAKAKQAFQNQNPFFQPGGQPQGPPTPATGKIALNNGQATMQGNLAANDPRDRMRPASPCKVFTIDMVAGKTYEIDMLQAPGGPDPYLRLEDAAGNNLSQDDDGGQGLSARIVFTCNQAGAYRVVATTFVGGVGNFTLQVSEK